MTPSVRLNAGSLAAQMRGDMRNTIEQHTGYDERWHGAMLEELVDDAMRLMKPLLAEVDLIGDQLLMVQQELERYQ